MSKNTRLAPNNKHTAAFLAKSFLMSSRCRKKIYKLNLGSIAILRYICDSIDLNYSARKKFHTRLYQGQIAKQNFCTIKTARGHIKSLIKARLLDFDEKNNTFTVGKVLSAWVKITYGIEVGKYYLPHRSRYFLPTSDSSDITNKRQKLSTGSKEVAESNIRSIKDLLLQKTLLTKKG